MRRWSVAKSHLVEVPPVWHALNVPALQVKVQEWADAIDLRGRRSFGTLSFRVEVLEKTVTLHCYFTDRHDRRARFMRLEEII